MIGAVKIETSSASGMMRMIGIGGSEEKMTEDLAFEMIREEAIAIATLEVGGAVEMTDMTDGTEGREMNGMKPGSDA